MLQINNIDTAINKGYEEIASFSWALLKDPVSGDVTFQQETDAVY
jgi:hypothetical protein